MLGDSAFYTLAVMVPAFKKGHNANLEEKKYLNTKLTKFGSRVCTALVYSKRSFNICGVFRRVIHDKTDLDAILKSTLCASILHNLLLSILFHQTGSMMKLWS